MGFEPHFGDLGESRWNPKQDWSDVEKEVSLHPLGIKSGDQADDLISI